MPPALSSPGFLLALAVLLANDLWWKAAFHNWLTGKLSDFAGLFVVVVLAATFRPRDMRGIAIATAAAFTIWKSPLSQPLIEAWNAVGPYRIARVVDCSDLLALAVIPVAVRYAGLAHPRAPAAVGYLAVAVSLLAVLGTSKLPPTTPLYPNAEAIWFPVGSLSYDVSASPATVVERLRQRDFTVQRGSPSGSPPSEVEIFSGVTCSMSADHRRFVHAQLAVEPRGDGASIFVRRVQLCQGDRAWDRERAARVFEAEVLERFGPWQRQPER